MILVQFRSQSSVQCENLQSQMLSSTRRRGWCAGARAGLVGLASCTSGHERQETAAGSEQVVASCLGRPRRRFQNCWTAPRGTAGQKHAEVMLPQRARLRRRDAGFRSRGRPFLPHGQLREGEKYPAASPYLAAANDEHERHGHHHARWRCHAPAGRHAAARDGASRLLQRG